MMKSEERDNQDIRVSPIGIIHSPFKQINRTPIQPTYAEGMEGRVLVFPEYAAGLSDLNGFERIWLVYWMDRTTEHKLRVIPFRDTIERGIFATRAPCRPNPIGLSCVRLLSVSGNVVSIAGVDVLDGTPLLDIKPYVPGFDAYPRSKSGWVEKTTVNRTVSDERFANRRGQENRFRERRRFRRDGTHDKRRG